MIRVNHRWTDPVAPESVFANSAYTATIDGVEPMVDGYAVTAVRVTIVNADGVPYAADAVNRGKVWEATFAESCFASYGFVSRGLKIEISGTNSAGVSHTWTRAVGDFEVVADSPEAVPGDPTSAYVVKGGDVYVKSYESEGVQHYLLQQMQYDQEMAAWGAEWSGDYVLSGGEFVPYE